MTLRRRELLAWCAGLIDGEGSVDIHRSVKSTGRVSLEARIRVHMTDRRAVERLREVLNVGSVTSRQPPPPRRRSWTWAVHDRGSLMSVLRELEPYLFLKRFEAALLLALFKNPNLTAAERDLIFRESKSLKLQKGRRSQ